MRVEDNLQIACIAWFKYQYPKIIITSFPAGYVFAGNLQQRARTGKRMNDMGYRKGMPDLFIVKAAKNYHGLFIELKTEKGTISKDQKETIRQLRELSYEVAICRNLESFIECVNEYLRW